MKKWTKWKSTAGQGPKLDGWYPGQFDTILQVQTKN